MALAVEPSIFVAEAYSRAGIGARPRAGGELVGLSRRQGDVYRHPVVHRFFGSRAHVHLGEVSTVAQRSVDGDQLVGVVRLVFRVLEKRPHQLRP